MNPRRPAGVYQPRSRRAQLTEAMTGFGDTLNRLLNTTLYRLSGLALIALGLALIAALASYDSGDPSYDNATARDAANWLGTAGAHIADFALRLAGVAALLPALVLIAWGWRLTAAKTVDQALSRAAAGLLGLLFLGAALGALPYGDNLPAGAGGFAGTLTAAVTGQIAAAFAFPAAHLVVPLVFAIFGMLLAFVAMRISPFKAFAVARGARKSVGGTWGRVSGFFFRPRKKKAAVQDTDDDEDDDDLDDDMYLPANPTDSDDEMAAVPEPVAFDSPKGMRVRREERRAKGKLKSSTQPALNLPAGEYQLPPLGLLS